MAADGVSLLVVCTGNTCRSVMAAIMLEHLAASRESPLAVATAGTHAVDGVPIGPRTLSALRTIADLEPALVGRGGHRSRQLDVDHIDGSDLVVAMEGAHVRYVRKLHPDAAARTGMLRKLARDLPPGSAPLGGRLAALGLERVVLDPADDVPDPAGHDEAAYVTCAADLWHLCRALVERL